jgi:hypothetical protein
LLGIAGMISVTKAVFMADIGGALLLSISAMA